MPLFTAHTHKTFARLLMWMLITLMHTPLTYYTEPVLQRVCFMLQKNIYISNTEEENSGESITPRLVRKDNQGDLRSPQVTKGMLLPLLFIGRKITALRQAEKVTKYTSS